MKYLSVRQPWASLLVAGIKDVENRSRPTKYRGELVIVSGKAKPDPGEMRTAQLIKNYYHPLTAFDWKDLPLGAALGTVRLWGCNTDSASPWAAAMNYKWLIGTLKSRVFARVVPFAAGRLGIFEGPELEALQARHDGSTRRVDARREVADIMITRPGIWGNPYRVKGPELLDRRGERVYAAMHPKRVIRQMLALYEAHIRSSEKLMARLPGLKGKRLGCFCRADQACHGDVLVKLVKELS